MFWFRAKKKVVNQKFELVWWRHQINFSSACFRQLFIGRRLSDRLIRKSWTAYTTEECQQFCAKEKDFQCRGFAYRSTNSCNNSNSNNNICFNPVVTSHLPLSFLHCILYCWSNYIGCWTSIVTNVISLKTQRCTNLPYRHLTDGLNINLDTINWKIENTQTRNEINILC